VYPGDINCLPQQAPPILVTGGTSIVGLRRGKKTGGVIVIVVGKRERI
jgi:hypothetical protein